jgi:hypothetical protein
MDRNYFYQKRNLTANRKDNNLPAQTGGGHEYI